MQPWWRRNVFLVLLCIIAIFIWLAYLRQPRQAGEPKLGLITGHSRVSALDAAKHAPLASPALRFNVLTTNIWRSSVLDGSNGSNPLGDPDRRSPQHFAVRQAALEDFFRSLVTSAHVVLMQEINVGDPIENALRRHVDSSHHIVLGQRGQAVIFARERFKLRHSWELKGGRGLGCILEEVTAASRRARVLVVASVHLRWMGTRTEKNQGVSTRRADFASILSELQVTAAAEEASAAFLGGDMNDPYHPADVALLNGWRDCWYDVDGLGQFTYPAFFDPHRFGHVSGQRAQVTFDWIFMNRGLRSIQPEVIETVRTAKKIPFSDHKPVAATLELVA